MKTRVGRELGADRGHPRFVLDTSPLPESAPVSLDADQRRVVDHRSGALLVLAGPGTGKTTTIVEAIAGRIRDEADPLPASSVLALTFGKRAAGELRDRVVTRLGGGLLPTVATFHSFAYGLMLQHGTEGEYREPPRLLSGAEEDVRIRDLLLGAIEDGSLAWPDELAGAVHTLGLANEVRAVLARAKELHLDPSQLQRIGSRSGRPAWEALGVLAAQESAVMVLENVVDYAELLHRAVIWARSPQGQQALRQQYRAIFVDEYQDTDPLQVALLESLVGPRTALVAVGDPDQSIYGFRGADMSGIFDFPRRFRAADGTDAPIVVLGHTRRFGPAISEAASRVIGRRPLRGIDPALAAAHRSPVCDPDRASAVAVELYDSEGTRAAHIAQQMRQAHLREGLPWSSMAVLVRTALAIPLIQRALLQAGVPAAVAADEIPLRMEPAVAVLLTALDVACDPKRMNAQSALDLLAGPLGALDASQIRRLGRLLRDADRQSEASVTPEASDVLIRDVLRGDRELPEATDDDLATSVHRVRGLIDAVHEGIAAGSSPQEALWVLWSGRVGGSALHGWSERLRQAALSGSGTAHHDIDAVMALFETAERASSRFQGVIGMKNFLISLRGQKIAAEPIAERSIDADAVRILTAHRAKGLEWDAVWIVGAEEGVWPDLRTRGSVLEPDRLTRDGVGAGVRPADLLAEERRLFFVALTRARERVVIASLAAEVEGGPQPSRFLDDVGVKPVRVHGRPPFAASTHGLVAHLRVVAGDDHSSSALRAAAVDRLASMALATGDDGDLLVPAANPDHWWGMLESTENPTPIRADDAPISLSGSNLEAILACPLKWFLEHDAHADVPRPAATKFGSVIHAVADYVAKGEVPADLESMNVLVDRVWRDLRFDAQWQSASERAEARLALSRFLVYHLRADRELVGSELHYSSDIEVPTPSGGVEEVRLRGYLDRIERDMQGRVVAIDLKNIKSPSSDATLGEHAQLGVYQLLLRENGDEVGGAALVQLRVPAGKGADDPKVQFQEPIPTEPPTWVEIELGQAAELLRNEGFVARPNKNCTFCSYRLVCPSQRSGEQVLT
jgi:superfamily I DNA/RNA helicase/RecB family exonuclease